ncbi:uncharacterized protein PFL1_01017 [Pseudozyma flocculosa PF-1]|uniref:Related to lariat-debranching enzyme n=1 Tax=Pseudozyma flocculosa TaxID=84751 RepID=A0A5C3FBE7_9BASI|nr:uncharacterized protein PFL1_01017 [Pseudozyma flocculosa PF-1]EPQ31684.1 hypothetical protein PFL1_01017 [Pseudozyma flocculosa PF-1]SPO40801.1 related to lariat-debranching enzyme [Pseudozyma flocculosa]
MKVAVEGCSHGELDAIYASILRAEREQGFAVDVVLLCGDFQAIRNHADLHCIAVPEKYRSLGGFHRYYSGELVAPILTIVVGGNHEASNYLWELYHGGWVAPNIYYLGAAGAVDVGGLTIAGASGIFKQPDYNKGRFERLPYNNNTIRSTYHTRSYDIHRLKLLDRPDVMLSHDWPNTIEQHGDTASLIKRKPYFKSEIRTETLGSPPLLELLKAVKPPYWFSAHLHVKFAALYDHDRAGAANPPSAAAAPQAPPGSKPEALDANFHLDDGAGGDKGTPNDDASGAQSAPKGAAENKTRFLALSKCLPGHDFLQYLDIPAPGDDELAQRKQRSSTNRAMPTFRFSKRWLAITRALHPQLSLSMRQAPLPPVDDAALLQSIERDEAWIEAKLASLQGEQDAVGPSDDGDAKAVTPPKHPLDVLRVQHFVRTAPAPFEQGGLLTGQPSWYTNPQTEALCHFLEIPNKINPRPTGMHGPPGGGGIGQIPSPVPQRLDMGPDGRPRFFPAMAGGLPGGPPFLPGPGPFPLAAPGGPPGGPFLPGPFPLVAPSGPPPPPPPLHCAPGPFNPSFKRSWDHDVAPPPVGAGPGPAGQADTADPNALDIGVDDFDDDDDEPVDETADPPPFALNEPLKRWAEGSG